MKQCKKCLEMYDLPVQMFGNYCPKCGTFNSNINKDSIIALLVVIVIGLILYFLKLI